MEQSVKKEPRHIGAIWSSLNRYMKVNSYHEIPAAHFQRAVKWLRTQKGHLNAAPSARCRNPNWRTDRYKAIHARCGNLPDGKSRLSTYLSERFGVTSLKDVSDDQLEATYRYFISLG